MDVRLALPARLDSCVSYDFASPKLVLGLFEQEFRFIGAASVARMFCQVLK